MAQRSPEITNLFDKYLNGTATKEETYLLLDYFNIDEHTDQLKDLILKQFNTTLPVDYNEEQINSMVVKLDKAILNNELPSRKRLFLKQIVWWTSAAIILFAGTLTYIIWSFEKDYFMQKIEVAEILPGGNKATLIIDGQKRIDLSELEGTLTTKDGKILYIGGNNIAAINNATRASIETPRAGQYKLILEDGTKIWLNAESKVSYPIRFTGNERRIVISGEVYLEVAKNDKQRSFFVETDKQVIQVLGTKFNIRAYPDNDFQATTLLEGSVMVEDKYRKESQIIKPGQQAYTTSLGTDIRSVDTEDFIGWTSDLIMLNSLNLQEVTHELERWYDVKFEPISSDIGKKRVFGSIKRNAPLKDILLALESSYNVQFTIKERRISIDKN
ncbi:MAG: FecR domain-containing protein [Sphingobacterium sp.]|nr:FecR domain-containing protein [Sphingobacterium sp.]